MPRTLLDVLTEKFPAAKKQTLKRMLQARRVTVNGKPAGRFDLQIVTGDDVRVSERAKPQAASIEPLRIVHEDADILVVEKPAGLLTSTTERERRATAIALVRNYLADSDPRARAGLIHRLDRDASGLLIFSKTEAAYDSLKTQFFKHSVDRVYTAVVHGKPHPTKGRIESRLIERADGSVHSTKQHATGQRAISDYEVISTEAGKSIVRVSLLTGRKHQIRVHLSERGWPIVGDRVYGKSGDTSKQLMLRAAELAITHPRSGKRISFKLDG